ncbi:hypothetical protein Salat_1194400 [Sesamum alatum]|uniref:Uncharacterized protein n=1 Tax=Sesamum alatum TaxID=300844 RepID=A0AAE2CP19_9LAMI|nr:hypothetical protein Salat_1194400 [Sesamum alatum]
MSSESNNSSSSGSSSSESNSSSSKVSRAMDRDEVARIEPCAVHEVIEIPEPPQEDVPPAYSAPLDAEWSFYKPSLKHVGSPSWDEDFIENVLTDHWFNADKRLTEEVLWLARLSPANLRTSRILEASRACGDGPCCWIEEDLEPSDVTPTPRADIHDHAPLHPARYETQGPPEIIRSPAPTLDVMPL